ncbi:MAG: hypothetical protein U0V64_12915 [Cyclobacteriaceae bacterium]
MNKPLFLLLSATIFLSCGRSKESVATDSTAITAVDSAAIRDSLARLTPPKPVVPKDTALDNIARFIAGLPQLDDNHFSKLQSDKNWVKYRTSMDTAWNQMTKRRLTAMADWRQQELAPLINDSLTLFYPFSGPDFLHAYTLYPHTTEYIMAALEPIRELPALDSMNQSQVFSSVEKNYNVLSKNRSQFFDSLGNSLRDVFNKSYFITNHMMKDLRQTKGVLPLFFFFLERTGNEMLGMEFIALDDQGNEKVVDVKQLRQYISPGVKMTFRDTATGAVKTLYYFSIDIGDKGMAKRSDFRAFIGKRQPYNTFVKSASYLMHHPDFKSIKATLLEQSKSIFQDDTGIPYKDIKATRQYDAHLYGEYVRPVSDFKWLDKQPDLDSAFKASAKPLPFSLGYHWSSKKQHYMLFLKK